MSPKAPRARDAPLAKADYEALAAFRYRLRRFLVFSQEAARAMGLTAQQHQALLAIKGHPGRDAITPGELAEHLCIRHHSAVGLVDRLQAKGLVRRRVAPGDRRQVQVGLTAAAETLLARLSSTHQAEIATLAPELSALLRKIRAGR